MIKLKDEKISIDEHDFGHDIDYHVCIQCVDHSVVEQYLDENIDYNGQNL